MQCQRGRDHRNNQIWPGVLGPARTASAICPTSYSVPPLEMGELAHERGGYVGIELAVQEDRSLWIAELGGYPREVIERADGLGLKAEAGGDRRKVDIWEHRFCHRLLAEFQEMQLGPIGAVVHDHDDERQVLAYYRL